MKAIDFRFRPNTPDAVDGLIHSPFFGDMCAFFNYPDRAWSASLDKIVKIMDEHEITGVITGRDVETTYGCPCSNMGVVEMMRAYPHKFYGMAGLDPQGYAGHRRAFPHGQRIRHERRVRRSLPRQAPGRSPQVLSYLCKML